MLRSKMKNAAQQNEKYCAAKSKKQRSFFNGKFEFKKKSLLL